MCAARGSGAYLTGYPVPSDVLMHSLTRTDRRLNEIESDTERNKAPHAHGASTVAIRTILRAYLLLHLLDQSGKTGRVVDGHIRQDLTVQRDLGLLQRVHER